MKQWFYVKNPEGYIVLENAYSAQEAKQRASSRPGFSEGTVAWPKACMPMGVDNRTAERPRRME